MKARIERERIPPGEDSRFHLKLGRGSLSDVEFTVQLKQLAHGARNPSVRTPSTLSAHRRAGRVRAPRGRGRGAAARGLRAVERARNYRYLLTGDSGDSLPTDGDEAEKLARMLGYMHRPQQTLREEYRRVTRPHVRSSSACSTAARTRS